MTQRLQRLQSQKELMDFGQVAAFSRELEEIVVMDNKRDYRL